MASGDFRASGALLTATGSSDPLGGSVAKPAGTVTGDTILIIVRTFNASAAVATPSGFTILPDVHSLTSVFQSDMIVFYRESDGSEGSTFSLSVSGAGGDECEFIAQAFTFENCTVGDSAKWFPGSESATITIEAVTTTGTNHRVVSFYGQNGNAVSGLSYTEPSGWTEHQDANASAVGSVKYTSIGVASKVFASAGSTGTTTATASASSPWHQSITVELVSSGGGDTTAPVLSSPTGTATGSTTATVGATTDEANGTQYAFVSTSATPPSATDLKAGTGATWSGSITISSTGANTHSATGLTASTGYYAHLIHTDAAANDSNIVTSAQFTTDAANAAPVWSGTPSAMSSKKGQALTAQDITSLVSDGDTLAYSLTGAPTGVTINSSTGIISGTPTAAPGVYACTVEADDGVNSPVSSSSFNITVTQCVLALNAAGYEFGDGNAPATMSILASTTLNAAVYPVAEWPPATAIATASGATNASGRLADLGDDDLLFGTSYRMIARNPSDGETWAWLMTAT